MSRKSVNARITAAKASTTLDAMMEAAKVREAAEAAEARKREQEARKAALPQPRQLDPEQKIVAARKAAEFRANGGTRGIARAYQERLAAERLEAQEEARRETWLKTPEGKAASERWLLEREVREGLREERSVRRAQRDAWSAHVEAEALRLRKEDLIETIQAGERADARLMELGRLPSSLLAQKGLEVTGCLQAKEAATRAEEELAKLSH